MLPAAVRRSSVHIPYNGVPQNSESRREVQSAHRTIRSHFIIWSRDSFGTHNIQSPLYHNGKWMSPEYLPIRLADAPRYITVHPYNVEPHDAGRRRPPRSPHSQHRFGDSQSRFTRYKRRTGRKDRKAVLNRANPPLFLIQ